MTLSQIVGPWEEPEFKSGLIARLRGVWDKPIEKLSNHELATCLRQKIAFAQLVPLSKERISARFSDGSEIYDGELAAAIAEAEYWCRADDEDRKIRGLPLREKTPNKAPEPTPTSVTPPANSR